MKLKATSAKRNNQNIAKLTLMLIQLACASAIMPKAFAQEPIVTNRKYEIPAGPLDSALNQFARNSGVMLSFPPATTKGKETKGLKGTYNTQEGFKELLKGTGLEIINDQHGGYFLDKALPPAPAKAIIPSLGEKEINLKAVTVRAKRFHEIGPLPGLGLTKEEIPGNVQSITAKEIKESHSLSLTDLMNKKLQSVNVNDYQGNPFQMDVTYRGFTAGPQIGTPQGLSVFLDGIRVNEPFGDVVNWDMIPMNAIAGVDVFPGSNPIFGLNTLGGAFTLKTKDGFNNEGVDAEILAGSYGRRQLQISSGINNGEFALFGAGNLFLEDGWRNDSPSKVNQIFGKGSYRGDKLDLNLSTLLVGTDLVGNGLLPSEEYAQNRRSVYTSPDTTKNRLMQFQISGAFQVNDTFSITGQAYRRNSKRHSVGADVFTDWDEESESFRQQLPNEQYTCLKRSEGKALEYGVGNYYVMTITNPTNDQLNPFYGTPFFNHPFVQNGGINPQDYVSGGQFENIVPGMSLTLNKEITNQDFLQVYKNLFNLIANQSSDYYKQTHPVQPPLAIENFAFGLPSYIYDNIFPYVSPGIPNGMADVFSLPYDVYFDTDANGNQTFNYLIPIAAMNQDVCQQNNDPYGLGVFSRPYDETVDPLSVKPTYIDGVGFGQSGVIKDDAGGFTPTALFSDNRIDQTVDGASIQFNWNLERHKFMVGASIDAAKASYSNSQLLGLLDASRHAFLAPDLISSQFTGRDTPINNNDFNGTNITKSIYFSETWTPVETWHFNAAARYNETQTKNKIATRHGVNMFAIGDVFNFPNNYAICPNGDCTNVPTWLTKPDLSDLLDPAETEKFSYYSFNPSLGATWQANPNLNVFASWAKGTRVPSVIELGCALDHTIGQPLLDGNGNPLLDPDGNPMLKPGENRECTLPTTLSGDPYLKQIRATTYDIGARGTFNSFLGAENIQWNVGAYQTDLKDDIYFINIGNGQGFFDNIGKTRRRGLEAGLSGRKDKFGFSLNYSLTDATFQDNFRMLSNDNSSSIYEEGFGNRIQVKPGDRMPGVPLHNLNANVSYEVTPQWQVGLSAVMHSTSYVRGNENNEHQTGVTQYVQFIDTVNPTNTDGSPHYIIVAKQPTTNPGKVPGYATFNFQTSYKFNKEWTATMLVNNLFDKEYFSAGRLGRNPFSPQILGAIGPDGYNHNSGDWRSTNFIAPSAPRGVWFSLNWQFDAGKNKVTSDSAALTEASEVKRASQPLPPSLNRYQGAPKIEE